MIAFTYAGLFSAQNLAKRYEETHSSSHRDEDKIAELHALSAGMKAIMSWTAQRYLQTLRELCGGQGFAAYNRIGKLKQDFDIFQTFEGDNTVLMQQLAGHLIKNFLLQFEGGKQFKGLLTYMRKQVGSAVANKNPVVTRLSANKHLRNPEFQLAAFEYRTSRILESTAMELRANKKKTGENFMAWNETRKRKRKQTNKRASKNKQTNKKPQFQAC